MHKLSLQRLGSSCGRLAFQLCGKTWRHVEALRLPGKLDRFQRGDPVQTLLSQHMLLRCRASQFLRLAARRLMRMYRRLWPMQIQVWNETSKPCAQLTSGFAWRLGPARKHAYHVTMGILRRFSQASALPPAGQLSGPGGPGLAFERSELGWRCWSVPAERSRARGLCVTDVR